MNQEKEKIYVYLDGDRIGANVELFLLDEDITSAAQLQISVKKSMQSLQNQILNDSSLELLMFGCDELILVGYDFFIVKNLVNKLRKSFHIDTGFTMSAGFGKTLRESLENLRRAKLLGRNRVIGIDQFEKKKS